MSKNLVCPPPSCSYTALSTVWGALARSQDAVCIAPAAAAATAAGCCLVLALLLLPPPGSGGDGCCISAPASLHTDILPVNHGRGSEGAPARDGERARDLQGSGLAERLCAHPPPPGPGSGAPGTRWRRREVERAQARAPGRKGRSRRGTGAEGGISRGCGARVAK